jgi:hypothetical protein
LDEGPVGQQERLGGAVGVDQRLPLVGVDGLDVGLLGGDHDRGGGGLVDVGSAVVPVGRVGVAGVVGAVVGAGGEDVGGGLLADLGRWRRVVGGAVLGGQQGVELGPGAE